MRLLVLLSVAVGLSLGHMGFPSWATGGTFATENSDLFSVKYAKPLYLDAPIDHFGESNTTFRLRYYVDATHFDPKNPRLFFVMGGEAPAEGLDNGYVATLAKKYGAMHCQIEHRYYGESFPFGFPDGYKLENMQYLTVEQALADAAFLIDTLDATYGIKGKSFAFGGSYSGALSTWFRISYPDHVVGALSSSGVVNALLEFPQFDTHIASVIDDTCAATIRAATSAFERDIHDNGGEETLKAFHLRELLPSDLLYMIADGIAMAVQYGTKESMCSAMDAVGPNSTDLIAATAKYILQRWGEDFPSNCFYNTECFANGPASQWRGGTPRSWRWQKCTQLAYLQVAPASGSLRSSALTLDALTKQCQSAFGLTPDTKAINVKFGGASPKATNVYFSDFSDDPWAAASVTKEISGDLPYSMVTCTGCGHCMDLHAPRASDPAVLKASRKRFEGYLEQWLGM